MLEERTLIHPIFLTFLPHVVLAAVLNIKIFHPQGKGERVLGCLDHLIFLLHDVLLRLILQIFPLRGKAVRMFLPQKSRQKLV